MSSISDFMCLSPVTIAIILACKGLKLLKITSNLGLVSFREKDIIFSLALLNQLGISTRLAESTI